MNAMGDKPTPAPRPEPLRPSPMRPEGRDEPTPLETKR
jgi:hypothetical protein